MVGSDEPEFFDFGIVGITVLASDAGEPRAVCFAIEGEDGSDLFGRKRGVFLDTEGTVHEMNVDGATGRKPGCRWCRSGCHNEVILLGGCL